MLSNLVYVSVRSSSCTIEDLEKIFKSSIKKNTDSGVTGVLFYSSEWFLQLIEGEEGLVKGLFDRIKSDKRHRDIKIISTGEISEKSFPKWPMGRKAIPDNLEKFFRISIDDDDKAKFNAMLQGKAATTKEILNLLFRFL